MRLRSLEMTNYRRYAEAAIEFPDGIIGVVGRNGAGKSTLLEAVTWCLFGHEAARTTKDLIKRTGAAPAAECRVRLTFDLDGTTYRVTRRMRGTSQKMELHVEADGALLVAGGSNSSAEGTAFLGRILGFDREAFHASVVARQGELNALSDQTPGQRRHVVSRMLGIDALNAAVRLARAERREAETELGYIRQGLAERDVLEARKAELETERSAAEKEAAAQGELWKGLGAEHSELETEHARRQEARVALARTEQQLQAARRDQTRAAARRTDLRAQVAALGKARLALDGMRSRLDQLAPHAAQAAALEEARAAFERAEEGARRAQRVRAEWEQLNAEAAEADRMAQRLAGLGAERAEAEAAVRTWRRNVETLTERRSATAERSEGLRGALADAAARGHHLTELGETADCPMCERPLRAAWPRLRKKIETEHERLASEAAATSAELARLAAALDTAKKELAIRESALAELGRTMEGLDRQLGLARRAAQQAATRRKEWEEAEAASKALGAVAWDPAAHASALAAQRETVELEREAARLEERVAREADLVQQLEAASAEEAEAERRIHEAAQALAGAESERVRAEEVARRLDAVRARREEASRAQAAASARAQTTARELGAVLAALGRMEELGGRATELEGRVRLLECLASSHGERGFLQAFKRQLMARVRPALARTASDLLARMTDQRYTELVLDEDYNIRVHDRGQEHPLARFSGGETDVVNLALRLAINELVAQVRGRSRLGFIALDEIFGSQDAERRLHVLAALKGLGTRFRQVLVITHLEEVQERLEHVVTVERDGASGSRLVAWSSGKV